MKLPGNMQSMMKQAQQMQERMQQEVAQIRVEASSGGGMVTVKMDGHKNVLAVKIEEALANLGGAPPPPPTPNIQTPKPTSNIQHPTSNSAPTSDQEWKQRLHATLMEIGMPFTADGVEHSTVVASASELRFTTPEEFRLGMKPDDINQAVRRILGRPMKIEIASGAAPAASSIVRKAPESETSARALANPEVKRFQEIFGGQIRTVRNLKE